VPWQRVLGADRGDTNIRGFTGFRKSIVAGVEVFPFLMAVFLMVSRDDGAETLCRAGWSTDLELVLEEVFLVGKFAVKAKEALFLLGERLNDHSK